MAPLDDFSVQFGQVKQSIHDLRNDIAGLTMAVKEGTQQVGQIAGVVKQQGDDIATMKPVVEQYKADKQKVLGIVVGGSVAGGGLAGFLSKLWGS